jgi:hypothetical protein
MMAAIFATMLLSVAIGWFGHRALALACFGICLALSIGLFLYEVYSPDYGFRLPWLQVEFFHPAPAAGAAGVPS